MTHAIRFHRTGGPEVLQWEAVDLPPPAAGEVLVRSLYSGVSRGTESLIFRGEVPESEYQRMRAPFQEGDFPGPVKYGYISVGVVEDGMGAEAAALRGRTVFCLHPHQARYVVPASAVIPLPPGLPPARVHILPTGLTILSCLMERLDIGRVRVTRRNNLDGYLYRLFCCPQEDPDA